MGLSEFLFRFDFGSPFTRETLLSTLAMKSSASPTTFVSESCCDSSFAMSTFC